MLDNKLSFYWHFRLWVQADITTLGSTGVKSSGLDNCMYLCKNCFIQTMSLPHLPPFLLRIHKSFLDNKQQEHGRRHFFPIPGQSVHWQIGEFLCPLCQCFGSTVLPLLPHIQVPKGTMAPCREIQLADWQGLINMAVDLAENQDSIGDGCDHIMTSPFPTAVPRPLDRGRYSVPTFGVFKLEVFSLLLAIVQKWSAVRGLTP